MAVNSLRMKLFLGIVLTIVPLVTVLIVNNHYSIQVVRNQVAQSNNNLLSMYMGQIDRNLAEADHYLYQLAAQNLDLLDLEKPLSSDPDAYRKAQLRLFNNITEEIGYYKSLDLFFIYSAVNNDLLMTQTFGDGYAERDKVRSNILQLLAGDTGTYDSYRWYVWHDERAYYLVHLVKAGGVYVGAWVNTDKLMLPLDLIDFGRTGAALFATDERIPMNHADLVEQYGISLQYEPGSYYLSGSRTRFLVMGKPSSLGNFNLVAFIPESKILENLPYLQRISSIISIGASVFLLLFIVFMRRVFLLPINRMIASIRKLKNGSFATAQIQDYPTSTEYKIMNMAFNDMITEIQQLKIDVYEEKLNLQRAELKHLQLQINPHFFLNSLTIIYNLATVKDFELIQEMSRCLVIYFRFMFRSNSSFVTLKDELMHTDNYLRIQQLRFPEGLSYRIDAPQQLLECPIPPLVIQTMVENSVKHAVSLDDHVEIDIAVERVEENDRAYLSVQIQDTGPGFPRDVLQLLHHDEPIPSEEGEHIGIWNVKQRLRLLYNSQAHIEFANEPGKGATVRFWLPISE